MIVQKIPHSERWKRRRPRRLKALTPIAPNSAPARAILEAANPAERTRIARWVAAQIVNRPPDNCFHCRRPIVFGAKWVELVNDNDRARFHSACAPAWRAQQVALARWAMGYNQGDKR